MVCEKFPDTKVCFSVFDRAPVHGVTSLPSYGLPQKTTHVGRQEKTELTRATGARYSRGRKTMREPHAP
jgi:hypothetical protein